MHMCIKICILRYFLKLGGNHRRKEGREGRKEKKEEKKKLSWSSGTGLTTIGPHKGILHGY